MANRRTIKIANPSLEQNQITYLTQDCNSAATTINVLDTNWFWAISAETDRYFLLLWGYWEEKSEIVSATAKTDSTFTISATKFSHTASEPVTYIPYNQIRFYGMVEEGDTPVLLDTVDIDTTAHFTSYTYTWDTYSYFMSRYYRSIETAVESSDSDIFSIRTFTKYSAKNIIESAVAKALTRIDENQNSVLNWNKCIIFLNEALEYIKMKKRKWQFLHKVTSTNSLFLPLTTTIGASYIENKPEDIAKIDVVKIDWEQIEYISPLRFNSMHDDSASWKPNYWTIKNGEIYLSPKPDAEYSVEIEYYKDPETIESLVDPVDKEFLIPVTLYVWAQAAFARGNDKRGDKLMAEFESVMQTLIEEHTWPWQSGTPEEVDYTSIYNLE